MFLGQFFNRMLIIQINGAGGRSSKALRVGVYLRRPGAAGNFFNRRARDTIAFAECDNVFSC
jgi:hypothetical protein